MIIDNFSEVKLTEAFINHFVRKADLGIVHNCSVKIDKFNVNVKFFLKGYLNLKVPISISFKLVEVHHTFVCIAFELNPVIDFVVKLDPIMQKFIKKYDWLAKQSCDELIVDFTKIPQLNPMFNFVYLKSITLGESQIEIALGAK